MHGARWGRPLVALDRVWTRFETGLAMVVLALEVSSMSLWVFLKGLSTQADSESHGGIVFRAVLGAIVLGNGLYFAFRRSSDAVRSIAAVSGVAIGFLVAKSWAAVGVDYTANLLNWYQQACFLTLLGGLRGVGTRLTLLLALVGGSLATARGKHVVLDIAIRFVSPSRRTVLVISGWIASAAVAAAAAWGFLDHISIEDFGARADWPMHQKIEQITEQLGEDVFVSTRQLSLDVKSVPHVVFKGETYADWLTGSEWNRFIATAGFAERYGPDATRGLLIPENEHRPPLVVVPGRGEPRGELVRMANLVFPVGLLIIALRFLLRSALVASGHAHADAEMEGDEVGNDGATVTALPLSASEE